MPSELQNAEDFATRSSTFAGLRQPVQQTNLLAILDQLSKSPELQRTFAGAPIGTRIGLTGNETQDQALALFNQIFGSGGPINLKTQVDSPREPSLGELVERKQGLPLINLAAMAPGRKQVFEPQSARRLAATFAHELEHRRDAQNLSTPIQTNLTELLRNLGPVSPKIMNMVSNYFAAGTDPDNIQHHQGYGSYELQAPLRQMLAPIIQAGGSVDPSFLNFDPLLRQLAEQGSNR